MHSVTNRSSLGNTRGPIQTTPAAVSPAGTQTKAGVCLVSEVKRSAILPGLLFLDRRQEIRKRTAPASSRALYLIRQRLIFVSESKQHFNRTLISNSQCHGPIPMGALP
jgi:hypothetical protein